MNYDQVANAVAQHVGTDPYLLQFFKTQGWVGILEIYKRRAFCEVEWLKVSGQNCMGIIVLYGYYAVSL